MGAFGRFWIRPGRRHFRRLSQSYYRPGAFAFGASTRQMSRLLFNPVQKSSKRVGYLRATVEDSNFCKALPFHDFRNRVARESLRRAFGKGSSFLFCVFAVQTSSQKTPRGSPPGVFAYPPFTQRFASDRVAFRDSPFRERPTGVRKEPSRSLPNPGISYQNSLSLWLTGFSKLTTRSLSDPGRTPN